MVGLGDALDLGVRNKEVSLVSIGIIGRSQCPFQGQKCWGCFRFGVGRG